MWRALALLWISLCLGSPACLADTVDDVLKSSDRSSADQLADAQRHPAETLRFFGVKPGQTILDFFAGGGYYSELLARTVGSKGHVDAYNNRAYADWVGRDLDARLQNNRLPALQKITTEVETLTLKQKYYDSIFLVMALHDTYYADPANGWPLIDRKALLAKLHAALKPGGILAVIDHSAQKGHGSSDTQSLHRIEEDFLLKDLQAAGFVLEARSDALRNPKDDRTLSSFDDHIRYQTDRFMLRLRKAK